MSPGDSGYFTCIQNMKLVTTKFKSGRLHEKHVVATWNLGNHLSIDFMPWETKKNPCREKNLCQNKEPRQLSRYADCSMRWMIRSLIPGRSNRFFLYPEHLYRSLIAPSFLVRRHLQLFLQVQEYWA